MPDIHAVVESLRAFMAAGGPVLWVIGAVAACMGFIIIERYWYLYLVFPANGRATLRSWQFLPRFPWPRDPAWPPRRRSGCARQ